MASPFTALAHRYEPRVLMRLGVAAIALLVLGLYAQSLWPPGARTSSSNVFAPTSELVLASGQVIQGEAVRGTVTFHAVGAGVKLESVRVILLPDVGTVRELGSVTVNLPRSELAQGESLKADFELIPAAGIAAGKYWVRLELIIQGVSGQIVPTYPAGQPVVIRSP